MSAVLGVSVSASTIRAVLVERGTIRWAGQAAYTSDEDVAEVIARLAGESGEPIRWACVALERDTVQLRTIAPVPPLKRGALQRYVALEAPRLFRKNGAPLVTDGISLAAEATTHVLWAAAVREPLLQRILEGAAQAGIRVEALGPAADVLPTALAAPPLGEVVLPNGETSEVLSVSAAGTWRSRVRRGARGDEPLVWARALTELGREAPTFAAAYAVTIQWPRLELWPKEARTQRAREVRRRLFRIALVGVACWLLAAGIYVGRLLVLLHASTTYVTSVSAAIDSALSARRDLDAGRATLATMAHAEQHRSRQMAVVASVTAALGDSAYLTTLQALPDGTVRMSGYASSAPQVLAALERIPRFSNPQFEGPVTRETTNDHRHLDRFAAMARLETAP